MFGVHPDHGMHRLTTAALMVAGKNVQTIEADRLLFERISGCPIGERVITMCFDNPAVPAFGVYAEPSIASS